MPSRKEQLTQMLAVHTENYRKARAKVQEYCNKIQRLKDEIAALTYAELFPNGAADITPEKVMTLNWEEARGDMYRQITDWFDDTFHYLYHGGYRPVTKQLAVQVKFHRDEPFEPQWEEVQQWLDHIKPVSESAERELLVFDRQGGEDGVYTVVINDRGAGVIRTYYSRPEVIFKSADVREVFEYVHKHHSYR